MTKTGMSRYTATRFDPWMIRSCGDGCVLYIIVAIKCTKILVEASPNTRSDSGQNTRSFGYPRLIYTIGTLVLEREFDRHQIAQLSVAETFEGLQILKGCYRYGLIERLRHVRAKQFAPVDNFTRCYPYNGPVPQNTARI